MEKLKLYIWQDVLCDYTPGIAFAMASSEDEARQQIRERLLKDGLRVDADGPDEFSKAPDEVYETPSGGYCYGGG